MTEDAFVGDALRVTAAELFGGTDKLVTLPTLLDLGWAELAADDLSLAVSTLAEAQGRHLGVSRLVELAMSEAGSLFDPLESALVFAMAPGRGTAFDANGPIEGLALADGLVAGDFVVPVLVDGVVALRRLSAADVDATPVSGIDPDAGVTRIHATGEGQCAPIDEGGWHAAVALGSLALAHELVGVSSAMLELAVDHAKNRQQFGVPIGTFQAVQHRLADVAIDIEAARAVCGTAWIHRDPLMCAAARSAAGLAFETASRHCHQVLGAMGSTWEHPMHRYQRRGLMLGRLLDPTPQLRAGLAQGLVDRRRVEVLEG